MSLDEQLKRCLAALGDLLDWVAEAERRLGSEQPLSEEVQPLSFQADEHQTLNEDIIEHQQPVLQTVQMAQQIMEQYASKLRPADQTKLEDLSSELKGRYDTVYVQSQTRQNRLQGAIPELQKIEEDRVGMNEWLTTAERNLAQVKRNIGYDLDTLQEQYNRQVAFNEEVMTQGADVRFLNMNGQRFLDKEKVGGFQISSGIKTQWLVHCFKLLVIIKALKL